jgi:hypothetical protein
MTALLLLLASAAYAARPISSPPIAKAPERKESLLMKGAEGEKLISEEDITCADPIEPKDGSLSVFLRLKDEVVGRAKSYIKENKGIKANFVLCGKPVAVSLNDSLEKYDDHLLVAVPKEHKKCVQSVLKTIARCPAAK